MQRVVTTLLVGALVLFLINLSMFTVDQRTTAIVFQFGEIVRVVKEPGIQFKMPLMQSVRSFDRRIQTIDADEKDTFNTSEKQNLMIDSFIKWQIADVERYYKAFGGVQLNAESRLKQIINSALRDEIGNRKVSDVITDKRDEVMARVNRRVNTEAGPLGVRILDVRVKRVEFPPTISDSVYERMNAERKRVANQLRSEGAAEAERIRADADRQREVILAEAYRKAQEIKGQGDAEASRIYAQAFGQNPDFYAFYKSLDAYQKTFRNKSDVLVLDPSSEFFRYMKNPGGSAPAKNGK